MIDLFPFIEKVGFPIVISLILLIRLENTMRNLTKSVDKLTKLIESDYKENNNK